MPMMAIDRLSPGLVLLGQARGERGVAVRLELQRNMNYSFAPKLTSSVLAYSVGKAWVVAPTEEFRGTSHTRPPAAGRLGDWNNNHNNAIEQHQAMHIPDTQALYEVRPTAAVVPRFDIQTHLLQINKRAALE